MGWSHGLPFSFADFTLDQLHNSQLGAADEWFDLGWFARLGSDPRTTRGLTEIVIVVRKVLAGLRPIAKLAGGVFSQDCSKSSCFGEVNVLSRL